MPDKSEKPAGGMTVSVGKFKFTITVAFIAGVVGLIANRHAVDVSADQAKAQAKAAYTTTKQSNGAQVVLLKLLLDRTSKAEQRLAVLERRHPRRRPLDMDLKPVAAAERVACKTKPGIVMGPAEVAGAPIIAALREHDAEVVELDAGAPDAEVQEQDPDQTQELLERLEGMTPAEFERVQEQVQYQHGAW